MAWRAGKLFVMTIAVMLALGGVAQGASSITITRPTGVEAAAESTDYATDNFGDPWDMSQGSDIALNGLAYSGISSPNMSGGYFSGTQANGDPSIFLVHPGVYSAIPTGRDGQRYPVNTTGYDSLSFRMSASGADDVNLYWFYNNIWTSFGVTSSVPVSGAQQIYKMDLKSQPYSWSGWPLGLRFELGSVRQSLGSFSLDWVKLYKSNTRPFTVSWNELSAGYAGIWLDTDANQNNGNEIWLDATMDHVGANSLSVDLSPYTAGTYYIFMTDGMGQKTVSNSFTISAPPLLNVTVPSEKGGEDFATTFGGDPWDMSQQSDIATTVNMSNSFNQNGLQIGVNAGNDPVWYFRMPAWIDTARYHRLTFRFAYDGAFDVGTGTVGRFIWSHNGYDYANFLTSDDIVVYPGWFEYTIDLATAATEGGGPAWVGGVNLFRFDPLEMPESRAFYLDYVYLTADCEANGSYPVSWREEKPAPRPTTVDIFLDPDWSAHNGNEIRVAQNVPSVSGSNTRTVDVRGVPSGRYNVLLIGRDDVNVSEHYATGPLIVYGPPALTSNYNGATLLGTTANFTWSAVPRAIGYGVELLNAPPEPSEVNGVAPSIHRIAYYPTQGLGVTIDVSGLPQGTYYYRAICSDALNQIIGGYSNTDSFVIGPTLNSFTVSAPGNQTAGTPFNVTITARDGDNNVLTTFNGRAALSDSTGTVSPALTGNFVNGVWTGSVTVTKAGSCNLTASFASPAASGQSGAFTVSPAALDHISVTSPNSSVKLGRTQTYTAAGYDRFNNPLAGLPFNWASTGGPVNPAAGASTTYTAGAVMGEFTVSATSAGITGTATVYVVNTLSLDLFYDNGGATASVWSLYSTGTMFTSPASVWASQTGHWEAARSFPMTGDFNRDGNADMVIFYDYGAATSGVFTMAGNGTTYDDPEQIWISGAGSWESARSRPMIGDYNRDGFDDIIIFYDYGGSTSAVWVMENQAGLSFRTPALVWMSDPGSWEAWRSKTMIGDYDNNGFDDIVIFYDYGGSTSGVWTMRNVAGVFDKPALIWMSDPGSWEAWRSKPMIGDYDDDDFDDIVIFYDYGGATSAVWTMRNNAGVYQRPVAPIWASNPGAWEAARSRSTMFDADGDGFEDIVIFYDYGGATSAAWTMKNNAGVFETPVRMWVSAAGGWSAPRTTVIPTR